MNACIIVNPISGGKDKKPVLELIRKHFPKHIGYEIIMWAHPEQKDEIAQKIKERNYDIVIAAGGDGTINQIARVIKNSNMQLGIIPLGSGNGLARHLNIPLDTVKAIQLIGVGKTIQMDACNVNGSDFFCTSGVGFDALISKRFAESKKRGFSTYVSLTFSNFVSYKPLKYKLEIDGAAYNTNAFLITMANASQYGNDAFIAPQADITDGKLDVVVLKPFKLWQVLPIAISILSKKLHLTNYVEVYQGSKINIHREIDSPVHFDGEPDHMDASLRYNVEKGAVKVIVP